MYREDKGALAQILSDIVQRLNATNQTVPHSINSSGTSAVNISTITTNSSRQIIVSPRPLIYTPRRQHNQDRLITNTTEEQTTKKRKTNESGDHEDSSKITAITMGTESQTEQPVYDLENGAISKQHRDVQTGLEEQQNY